MKRFASFHVKSTLRRIEVSNLPVAKEMIAFTLGMVVSIFAPLTLAGSGQVFLIHTGDIHGHLVPRPNVRSDAVGGTEGGLARMYTLIQQIRSKARQGKVNRSLLINTGDTLQGSGEALFTRGQAMIDVLNLFKIDAHAPGNWDFLYGTARFEEVFKGRGEQAPLAPWNALASNLYYTNQFDDATECGITGEDAQGTVRKLKRVLPPYAIKRVGEVKVGLLGFTTARAVAAIGPKVTAGYQFSDAEIELPCYVDVLRKREKVDLLVMISELELSRDIKLVEMNPGVDVVLNSDMHEKTTRPIIVRHVRAPSTLLFEEGQDGTMIGELQLNVKNGKVADWHWTPHIVSAAIMEDKGIAAKVAEVRRPFLKASFVAGQSVTVGGNTSTLLHPVDEVIAYSQVNLHRSNFVDEDMPAVVEGSSHDLIADAMRWAAGADVATLRGFRYGTHIPAGQPITMEDIYHYVPIAAKLGRSQKACGADLKTQIENSTAGVFHPDSRRWQGGWMFAYSGVTYDLDACGGFGIPGMPVERATNIKVNGVPVNALDAYDEKSGQCKSGSPGYKVAGYWYADDPTTINNCKSCKGRLIQMVTHDLHVVDLVPGQPIPDNRTFLDITEAVVKYLQVPLSGKVTSNNLSLNRIKVTRLPRLNTYPFKIVQPLEGATRETCPMS
ncbi:MULTISPECIES: bifunctional metallophosphatase/5'-nucleotidase [Methylococcus]|uniref:Bifunctional metallophosphatase/5'-nucleotidase n=1 Tax=Methylococcus capsulatus TaxID=414 RepID=A0ABZ2F2G8_METCP|nr:MULTISPECIES: bifunctional metallophosphatase/5'-nucleotidase [Methylococcus]MDF9391378.1 hypothetical protein [Methylococcus capsulatus]